MKVSVSFLKSKDDSLTTIQKIDKSSCDFIHLDVMDGEFVKENTFSTQEFKNLVSEVSKPLDIHLMMNQSNASQAIEDFSSLHPTYISVHVELPSVDTLIEQIKKHHIKVGLAINPETPKETLLPYLPLVDMILVMSVEPGEGGQTFIDEVRLKLKDIKNWCLKENLNLVLSVDGGINQSTIDKVKPYCDMVVSGSFVCMSEDFEEQIQKLK